MDIESRCAAAGVVFQPMIFESLGGVSSEAERVIKCLNKLVAFSTGSSGQIRMASWRCGQKRTKVEKRVVFPYKNPYS